MASLIEQGYSYTSASQPWSVSVNNESFRFELRAGDGWSVDADSGKEVERAEISSVEKLLPGETYTLTYSFVIDEGPKNTAEWVNIGQFRRTPDEADVDGAGPMFAVKLKGEKMYIVARTDPNEVTTERPEDIILYLDDEDIVRGHVYDMKVEIRVDPAGEGLINVWRDGEQIVAYEGPVGYNDAIGPYWKQGVYRSAAEEPLTVTFSNVDLTREGGLEGGDGDDLIYGYGGADSILGNGGADSLVGGLDNDTIVGGGGRDEIWGDDGDDVLDGGDGQDFVLGGDGSDTILGDDDRDILWGESGHDSLRGGSSNDTLDGAGGCDTLSGDAGHDLLIGGGASDFLRGGNGDDTLAGGTGADTLSGGAGADAFAFELPNQGRDQIVDFRSGEDRILLSQSGFGIDDISDVAFILGRGDAPLGGPALHYEESTGKLFWNADGGSFADAFVTGLFGQGTVLNGADFGLMA